LLDTEKRTIGGEKKYRPKMARFVFQPFCETEVNLLLYVEIWCDRSLKRGARGVVEQEATQGKGETRGW
jgi:hypothetical protein